MIIKRFGVMMAIEAIKSILNLREPLIVGLILYGALSST